MDQAPLDPLLEALDQVVRNHLETSFFLDGLAEVETLLAADGEKAFVPFPVGAFHGLPREVRLVRLFGLQAGALGPRERHPNSHQRVVSLVGIGQIRVWTVEETASVIHALHSDCDGTLCNRWSSVPSGLWHQPSAGPGAPWIALALHTAGEGVLIDEYDDSDTW